MRGRQVAPGVHATETPPGARETFNRPNRWSAESRSTDWRSRWSSGRLARRYVIWRLLCLLSGSSSWVPS